MFTGIVQQLGRIADVRESPFGRVLVVDPGGWDHQAGDGDSIAVNGCCLTVAERSDAGWLRFDVIRQTLEVTTLGALASGAPVNLESAVTPSTALGGHIVQGHIDGMAVVEAVVNRPDERRLRLRPSPLLMDFIVTKGSVALEGVSMTVAEVDADVFEVALIPTTIERTTLGGLAGGDRINLETDYVAKIVVGWMKRRETSGAE